MKENLQVVILDTPFPGTSGARRTESHRYLGDIMEKLKFLSGYFFTKGVGVF